MAKERHVTWRKLQPLQPSIDLLGRAIQHQLTALSRMSFLSRGACGSSMEALAEVAGTVSNGTIDIPAELIFFPGHHRQPSRLTLDQNYFACLYFLMFSPCFHHVFTMFSPCFRNHLPAPNHLRAWHSIHRISYEEVVLPSPCHWDCCAKTAVTAFA